MKKLLLLLLALLLILSLTGCFGPTPPPAKKPNIFFNAVKNTAPVFMPDPSAMVAKAWTLGGPVFEMYRMFQEYEPDDPNIGLENIYKLVYQAGQFFNDCQSIGTSIDDTLMTSPFPFGRMDNTYNKVLVQETGDTRGNYFATKKEGTINYGLLSWYIYVSAAQIERGILQGSYDEGTGDLNIDLVCFVDYTGDVVNPSKYSLRTHLEGNAQTHNFSKLITGKWNYFPEETPGYGYCAWYVGSGVSRGVGNWFLFKVADNNTLAEPGRYFEFPAEASVTTLQGISEDGLPDTTSPYKATVNSLVAYDVLDDLASINDVPTDATDFGGAGLGNMKPQDMP
jgi:predicted small lipoprotein YifL